MDYRDPGTTADYCDGLSSDPDEKPSAFSHQIRTAEQDARAHAVAVRHHQRLCEPVLTDQDLEDALYRTYLIGYHSGALAALMSLRTADRILHSDCELG